MFDETEVILWRKYYFSLSAQCLYKRLLHREVPLIPDLKIDFVSALYERLDRANDYNYDWSYTEYLVWRFVTYIKCPTKRHKSPAKRLSCAHRSSNTSEYIIFEYANGNVISRIYEPFTINNTCIFFRYTFHENLGEFFLYETKRGTNLLENFFLRDLADSIHYDNWLLNKFINKSKCFTK